MRMKVVLRDKTEGALWVEEREIGDVRFIGSTPTHIVVISGDELVRTTWNTKYWQLKSVTREDEEDDDGELEIIDHDLREFDVSLSCRVEATGFEEAARTFREWILDPGADWMFRVTDVSNSRRIEMVDGGQFREV